MNTIEIHIYNELVGVLSYDELKKETYFEYAPSFLKNNIELAPIVLPKRKGVMVFSNNDYNSYKGLPEFISDSLPDKFGTEVIKEYLLNKGIGANDLTPLEKLAYRGNRAMGALEFYPSKQTTLTKDSLDVALLNDLSNKIVNNEEIGRLEDGLVQLFEFGTSPGGAQPKIIVNRSKEGVLFRGDNKLKEGESSWILKFNNAKGDFGKDKGKVEYAYYLMAKAAGISINDSELLDFNGEKLFITKRFDRTNTGEKTHMQTAMAFAKMDWKNRVYGYEDLFKVLQFIGNGQMEKQELFRRMVFNILSKNVDDHTKNFSFLMNKQGEWCLSPAYDLVFTAKYGFSPHLDNHFLSINGKRNDFKLKDVLQLANDFNVKKSKQIIEQVNLALKGWRAIATDLSINEKHINFIEDKINVFPYKLK